MADDELVESLLESSVSEWNKWRANYPRIQADLRGAYLRGLNLGEANLSEVILSGANLSGAYLGKANPSGISPRLKENNLND